MLQLAISRIFNKNSMSNSNHFEVIIIGGSYAGLAAALALGRAIRSVLVIDSGLPCNRQTPYSNNFITQDGVPPAEIARLARGQVEKYSTVQFLNETAIDGAHLKRGFEVRTSSGKSFTASRLIFATGIEDLLPGIEGVSECWGISVLHCPYCHGYEVTNRRTAVLANGNDDFEFAALLSNWTRDLMLLTNRSDLLTDTQKAILGHYQIAVVEKEISEIKHSEGRMERIVFKDGTSSAVSVLYIRNAFRQQCNIPETLGCELINEGYLKVDAWQKTSVAGIAACGDNTSRMRTVANAVAMGTTAGMSVNKELVLEQFGKQAIELRD